ncbi:hypothetical protein YASMINEVIRUS_534 [Yasminevirus sp. GU-2018]|uniref:Uncharacterized protein n=1 Tax=Yasminevirus sp. GU-2018 TaxID=2420051 RepID=A0A5K0U940_9VIRU|nr:hypothetical protein YASMINEVIRUS_534 [Yasminevirus sp. GU-2018]
MPTKEDLAFLPVIFENKTANAVTLMIIPAFFYTAASYGHLYFKDISIRNAILMAITFAIMEYIVRVPVIHYSSQVAGLSQATMQILWVCLTITLAFLSDQLFNVTVEDTGL